MQLSLLSSSLTLGFSFFKFDWLDVEKSESVLSEDVARLLVVGVWKLVLRTVEVVNVDGEVDCEDRHPESD